MKILILALSGIGDALMFTPALSLLRKELPNAEIDVLVMIKSAEDLFGQNKNISKVIHFDFLKQGFFPSLKFISTLRGKYDLTISVYPSNRKEYNIINYLIGAERKAGIEYLRKDKQNLGFLNNTRVKENDALHNVQTNIKLVEKILGRTLTEEPGYDFPFSEEDLFFARNYLKDLSINESDFVVGLHPGCAILKNHIKRRWEPEKFAALADLLIKKEKAKILIFGGLEEDELKKNIASRVNSPDVHMVKAESLSASAAVMKRCSIFVTNDSSLMHVASAVGLKIVALIGPTNRFYIHPWKTDYRIVSLNLACSPCFFYSPKPLKCYRDDILFKCIKEINVEMVYDAVKDMMRIRNGH
jgi:heptosyltransferase II